MQGVPVTPGGVHPPPPCTGSNAAPAVAPHVGGADGADGVRDRERDRSPRLQGPGGIGGEA
eukprot:12890554-Prorocentrum_lima.AAC.1